MLTATVPIISGTSATESDLTGAGVATLIDTAPDAGLELPCRTNNPDLWFADAPAELEVAKKFCAACPVIAECLAGALSRHEPWGVWGGEIFERGAVIARKRPRGRPRKDATPVAPAATVVPAQKPATATRRAADQEVAA
ncbi:WhiB family transcriptional regulator [Actinosynnema pretiosum subsp. pretiosum]|uniref:Transcriptional regulator WhiB n=3 Tax=Actinosynnema TaxID=40566 RepID=C6WMF5_ACTMD|nr:MULTISPECIES: WhiB family transcriptional regulator [Actinosynnema]ACU34889.1 transcription factor WhiB [Actinosynnema mirum DSM 43827]ATE52646.1 WhiB family transcriptional regulator [Actinosynnema pretiosum]AXX28249.1 WhiB-family transcriptional regulator [Actinosynnema pretiosum subsp. pretiosum]QUF07382.1 WhiB family transcriptional regulator [Actinosynnema pretiosum subsp. pretiosum]